MTMQTMRRLMKLSRIAVLSLCLATGVATAMPPNISGVWNRYPDPYPDVFSPDPPPPGGEPPLKEPYQSAYLALQKRQAEADESGKPLATPSTRCFPEGMPTIMGAHYALQILQTPGQVTVLAEFMTQTRRIYLNEALPPLADLTPTYNGYSVARWRGNTLEVHTIGVREDVLYLDMPHSAKMKVTERIHLTAPDLLQDDITIEDPEMLTHPYKFTFGYKKEPRDYKVAEYVCDNNHSKIEADGTFRMEVEP